MMQTKNIYEENGWEIAEEYPVGTELKILRDQDGAKTILLKLPKDFRIESHTHVYVEQHFILEGEYESEGKIYLSGTYRFIPAHKDHGPFTSQTGALVLVIWDPVKNNELE